MNHINNAPRHRWLDGPAVHTIQQKYTTRRGLKLFGYSSDESVNLLTSLSIVPINDCMKRNIIDNYLDENKNQGKRLYDILIEERILFTHQLQQSHGENLWLSEDMVYLIDQKYKKNRGFKFFGYSCPDSVALLEVLRNKQLDLKVRQDAVVSYLSDDKHNRKRLFDVLNEVKCMNPNAPIIIQMKA